MSHSRSIAAALRLSLVSCAALAATVRSARLQSPASTAVADLQAEVAAPKAELSQRDAELARRQGGTAESEAPAPARV